MNKRAYRLLITVIAFAFFTGCSSNRFVARSNGTVRSVQPGVAAGPPRESIPENDAENVVENAEVRLVDQSEEFLTNDGSLPPSANSANSIVDARTSTITLEQLESLALQHNPTLIQAQAEIEVDQGFLKQAGLYPNPQVGYINGTASNPAVRQSNGVFLSQEFVTAHKLDLAQQSILQEIKQMQWDQVAQRMRVMNDLKIRYFEVLGTQRTVKIAEKLVTVAKDGVELAERALAGGNATRSDVLQAKVQLDMARLNLDDAEFRRSAAWKQLVVIVGLPLHQQTELEGELDREIPERDEATCLQTLLTYSPQLKGSASQLDHGWAEYRSQRAQAIPNITVQSVIDYDRATQATTASTLVAMPLPVFSRNQGNIDKAAADIRLFQAEITRSELVLRDQLATSFQNYNSKRREVEVLKTSIIPNSEENLQLTRELYNGRQCSLATVLAAQQTYFQSEMAYVGALTELHKIVAEIDGMQLTGGLNPPAIGSAIQAQPGGGIQRQRALLKDIQDRSQKQLLPAAQISQ